uniref:Uncharacterized protein n=1 Tax=Rhizophora mucronata TaxID=61149 RepID=A0A2P2PA19_RHIMU
MYLNSDSHS